MDMYQIILIGIMKRNKEIYEMNMLIAYFMGYLHTKENYVTTKGTKYMFPDKTNSTKHINDLRYNLSWDWLMSVVEKIESLDYHVVFHDTDIYIYGGSMENYIVTRYESKEDKKDAVYKAVIEFINWYNKNK